MPPAGVARSAANASGPWLPCCGAIIACCQSSPERTERRLACQSAKTALLRDWQSREGVREVTGREGVSGIRPVCGSRQLVKTTAWQGEGTVQGVRWGKPRLTKCRQTNKGGSNERLHARARADRHRGAITVDSPPPGQRGCRACL